MAVAALVALAAAYLPSDAGSVNGTTIGQSTLNADLSAIAGSAGFQCYLYADQELNGGTTTGMFPVEGVSETSSASVATATKNPGSINAGFARYWLSQLLTNQLVVQLLAQLHLTVTPADLAFGRTTLSGQMTAALDEFESESGDSCGTAATILASLPAGFRAEQVQVQANQDVLFAHEAGYSLGTAGLHRYFTAHQVKFETICYDLAPFASESEATAARATLATGTSFTKFATASSSCAVRLGLPSSVASLAVGKVSSPVALSGGEYGLVQITGVKHTSFTVVKVDVEDAVLEAGEARASALVRAASRRAVVTADPRYGRVVPRTTDLLPPLSPPAGSVLNPAVNLPAVSTGGGSGSSGA